MKSVRTFVLLSLGTLGLTHSIQAALQKEEQIMISKTELRGLIREEIQSSIGFIDPMRVFEQSDQYKDEIKNIEKELEVRKQQLKSLENTAMKKKAEMETMANALSDSAKERKKEEMINLESQYRIKLQSAQEFAENAEQKARMKILRTIQDAAESVAKEQNMVLVFGTGVVYGAKAVDLTDKVIEQINKKYRAEKGPQIKKKEASAQAAG